MNKKEKILYLQKIKKYLKLNKLCELYNESHENKIDYNNLRVMVNMTSDTRLSEERLNSFIIFINDFFKDEIMLTKNDINIDLEQICRIITDDAKETCKKIKEIKNYEI